jgi:hypothetical protein
VECWGANLTEVEQHLAAIETIRERALAGMALSALIPTVEIDFSGLAAAAAALVDVAIAGMRDVESYERRNLDQALTAASALMNLATSMAARLYRARQDQQCLPQSRCATRSSKCGRICLPHTTFSEGDVSTALIKYLLGMDQL